MGLVIKLIITNPTMKMSQPKVTINVPSKSRPTGPYSRRRLSKLLRLTEDEHKLILSTSKLLGITDSDFMRGSIIETARAVHELINGARNSN